jgi:hypothetical protein
MKSAVHNRVQSLKGTWDLGGRRFRARGLPDCVEGSWIN